LIGVKLTPICSITYTWVLTYSLANSGRFIGTAGLNILDLRNMGTDRTLVLVDGKRHVSSSAGSASVDTNTIPSAWVERVEIITGGASAVYGADAVTGVVNFILKKNIEGLEVSATKGFSDEGPYKNAKYTLSYGQNFDGDRGNAAFSVEYVEQNRFNRLDRKGLSTPYSNLRNTNQPDDQKNSVDYPDKIYTPNAGNYSFNNAGIFSVGDDYYSFNRDGTPRKQFLGGNVDGIRCSDCDVFNLGQFTDIQPKFDRLNLNFKVNYDNAFIGNELGQLMDDNQLTSIQVRRMMTDLGVRIEEDERETQRFVLGAEGELSEDWSYDVSAIYGVTDHTRINLNNLIRANYANALDSVRDANGNAICRSQSQDGCVAVDILGFGAPSQAAIDYINTTSVGSSKIEQTVMGGSISNSEIFDMPAGSVGFAMGLEYRKEESVTEEPSNAVGTFFNALGEDEGSFNVREVFVEMSIPLLTDLPLIEDLVFETAARYADYSTIGDATSWKTGIDWSVGYGLRIRSTYSEALRAPNIGEIFGAESETFFNIDDSCRQENLDDLANKTTRANNCAALGVPADFNSTYDSASIRGSQSGNQNIKEEKSESTTIGFVYQPEFIEGTSLTVDYWKIKLTDAISTTGAQDIIDRCVDSESGIDNQYCRLITRNASSHEITLLQRSVLNLSGQEAAGIDFELGYDFALAEGDVRTTLIGTYLKERKTYPFQEDPSEFTENAGTTGEAEWQANFSIGYTKGDWNGTWKSRYLQEVSLYTTQELEDNPNPSSLMTFPSYVVSDMAVGYNFENGINLKVGIDNVFDKDLPIGTSGTGSNGT
jgi:iron complex outermembrane receptor protein